MSAMFRFETTREEIEEVIDNLIESGFHSLIRNELGIADVTYEIMKRSVSFNEGFPDTSIKASAVLNQEQSKIRAVMFFTESMSDDINNNFSRISDLDMFYEVVRVYVKFVLIHELVHVRQIKNGMTMEEYRRTKYENNGFEIEANRKAIEVLSREGEFQRAIADMVASNRSISDNGMAAEFITRFS